MKTPSFWATKNPIALLLFPLSKLYAKGRKLHVRFARPMQAYIPVICVGNAVAGGAGKTPAALAIGALLKARNAKAVYLSRGYGGKLKGPVFVNLGEHKSHDVGDEPLLLSHVLPTIVSKDRKKGAIFAEDAKAKIIVMDDGFQNPTLLKDFSFLVIDAASGFGNGFLLPAGPLREPEQDALDRADAVILVGDGDKTPPLPNDLPVLRARIIPSVKTSLAEQKVFAFCGIANPEKFYATVESLGAEIIGRKNYADHAPYSDKEIVILSSNARLQGALLVTTRKDAVRIHSDLQPLLTIVDIELVFDEPEKVTQLFEAVLA
ncbi:MAG: tetraacyldisaccharide 4'-kinase [Alphaproteobacteria bacterium]|nr:tetraacyldisaccharide 4'-kinase [Alphaproteobacteria bacterium]